jgi:hypothetical protein
MDKLLLQLVQSKLSLNYGNILLAASLLLLELYLPLLQLQRSSPFTELHLTRTAFAYNTQIVL